MDIHGVKRTYPHINREEFFPHFPKISMADYPELQEYTWEVCHQDFLGAGGLFLVSELAEQLQLKPGMRVLDLCCGKASSSLFLAKHYGVTVFAIDRDIQPSENWKRVQYAKLTDAIVPMSMEARDLRFPETYFDAILCVNSYFYFGTDDWYLPYLTRSVKSGGRIGIASPCYTRELEPATIQALLNVAPGVHEYEYDTFHSPTWWRGKFEMVERLKLLACEKHPKGRAFWLDQIRWLLEECHPSERGLDMQNMILQDMLILLADQDHLLTYLTILAERQEKKKS
jgi:ubiquinone/menaquinone biosynthesis C-methylase UbiE